MENKKYFKIGILLLAMALIFPIVSAANIGVSPAKMNFKNVLRGGYSQRPLTITMDTKEDVNVEITKRGEISDWIKLSEYNFSMSGKAKQVMVSVSPPADTPNGNYTGFIIVKTPSLASGPQGGATAAIMPTLEVFVTVQVTDEEVVSCQATNFEVSSVEQGDDIVFYLDVLNSGNIRLSPTIKFEIWNQDLTNVVKEAKFSSEEVTPTQKKRIEIKIPSKGLDLGQYWVDVSALECFATQTLTFDVLEEGALRAAGILESINVIPWADVDDIVPISISFKNTGEKPLDAKFSGKVMYNNKVIQLLESDEPLSVPIGKKSDFEFYFTPRNPGRYIISGRVFYDSKRSYEQSAVLNVRRGKITFGDVLKFAIYIVLFAIIIVLISKIHKQRKVYLSKIRRLRR